MVGTFASTTVLASLGRRRYDADEPPRTTASTCSSPIQTSGALRWASQVKGPAQIDSHGLAVLADGSFLVSGNVTATLASVPDAGKAVFGPGEPNKTTLTGNYFDLFLARYESDRRLSWAKLAPGAQAGDHNIVPLAGGDIVVAGTFGTPRSARPNSTAVFGPGEPGQITLTRLPGADLGHVPGLLPTGRSIIAARTVAQSGCRGWRAPRRRQAGTSS